MDTPVLFLVFNRPDITLKVFEEIRRARPARLYIAADGPRKNKPGEAILCDRVREIVKNIDWDCDIKTLFRENNLGCKKAVSSAIDWFFENEPMGIILEDDCLPHPSFFNFCKELLNRYRDDERIMMISGTNFADTSDISSSYYYSTYPRVWGWASWRRVWNNYDVTMEGFKLAKEQKLFNSKFTTKHEYEYWMRCFEDVSAGKIDTWDIQLSFTAFVTSRLTVCPKMNLISNIGFGPDATHTSQTNRMAALKVSATEGDLKAPQFMMPLSSAESYIRKIEGVEISYSRYILKEVKRHIKSIIPGR